LLPALVRSNRAMRQHLSPKSVRYAPSRFIFLGFLFEHTLLYTGSGHFLNPIYNEFASYLAIEAHRHVMARTVRVAGHCG
jgi:hypothetical protein